MIEIFKTNIEASEKEKLITLLHRRFPEHEISIDLFDCDKVLRVKGKTFKAQEVIEILNSNGNSCRVMS
jgi:hypothetical protein